MRPILLLIIVVVLTSCGALQTKRYSVNDDSDKKNAKLGKTGIIYSLPMRMAKLSVSRKPVPPDLEKKIVAATNAAKDAGEALKQAEQAYIRNYQVVALRPDNAAAQAVLAEASAALEKAQKAQVNAKEKLEALNKLKQIGEEVAAEKSLAYELKLELLPVQADPRQTFIADLNHNPLRDDDLELRTTASGLLTTSKQTATDRVSDILVSIAGTVGAFGGVSGELFTGQEPFSSSVKKSDDVESAQDTFTPPECAKPGKAIKQQHVFDPSVKDEVDQVNRHLLDCLIPYRLDIGRYLDKSTEKQYRKVGELVNDADGLVYRRPVPYLVEIERYHGDLMKLMPLAFGTDEGFGASIGKLPKAIEKWYKVEQAELIEIPNGGPLGIVPYSANAFVITKNELEFEDGQPITWVTNKPSELAAFFRIPVDVAKALVAVPAEILKIRVDYSSDEVIFANSNLQLLCTSLRIESVRNQMDDDAENDEDIIVPDVCNEPQSEE